MAISIFHHPATAILTVIAGYESGHTSVSYLPSSAWKTLYISQPHTQPILSLDVAPSKAFYLTSSADAIIAQHPIPLAGPSTNSTPPPSLPLKTMQTKHAGQQGLQIRNDGKIFATSGWDSKVRVYSTKTLKELAVLKWHKEGCYSVGFADVEAVSGGGGEDDGKGGKEITRAGGEERSVKEERLWKARNTHWLVAGSKDGKVSLWEIY